MTTAGLHAFFIYMTAPLQNTKDFTKDFTKDHHGPPRTD